MTDAGWSGQAFQSHRAHLRSVAYRMLGSVAEADDAVQEAWLRFARSDIDQVRDLRAWLTTVVARVALDMLRSRAARRESPLSVHLPDPLIEPVGARRADHADPAEHALEADAVGLALLVILDPLSPTERLAFVLHDVFGVPFDQIGEITGRSTSAAKQLASRARRRVRESPSRPSTTPARQRQILDAFLAAAGDGDFEGLVTLPDPDVVLHADAGAASPLTRTVRGATAVAGQALRFAALSSSAYPVLVNRMPGLVAAPNGRSFALLSATVRDDRIVEIDIIADNNRLVRLGLPTSEAADG
ncbi:MAG TPA: sigma-70 family RNA polymerase sigma factor [Nakamurella sp.]|jgi:RNA polymerase sigma-70 factor (ECF subfamily)